MKSEKGSSQEETELHSLLCNSLGNGSTFFPINSSGDQRETFDIASVCGTTLITMHLANSAKDSAAELMRHNEKQIDKVMRHLHTGHAQIIKPLESPWQSRHLDLDGLTTYTLSVVGAKIPVIREDRREKKLKVKRFYHIPFSLAMNMARSQISAWDMIYFCELFYLYPTTESVRSEIVSEYARKYGFKSTVNMCANTSIQSKYELSLGNFFARRSIGDVKIANIRAGTLVPAEMTPTRMNEHEFVNLSPSYDFFRLGQWASMAINAYQSDGIAVAPAHLRGATFDLLMLAESQKSRRFQHRFFADDGRCRLCVVLDVTSDSIAIESRDDLPIPTLDFSLHAAVLGTPYHGFVYNFGPHGRLRRTPYNKHGHQH